jgi:hypothetical protein
LRSPVGSVIEQRVLSARWAPITVRASTLGRDAAVVGAARSGLREVLTDPLAALAR